MDSRLKVINNATFAKMSLEALRRNQSFGMSLKKAVKGGFVKIATSIEDGSREVIKVTSLNKRMKA